MIRNEDTCVRNFETSENELVELLQLHSVCWRLWIWEEMVRFGTRVVVSKTFKTLMPRGRKEGSDVQAHPPSNDFSWTAETMFSAWRSWRTTSQTSSTVQKQYSWTGRIRMRLENVSGMGMRQTLINLNLAQVIDVPGKCLFDVFPGHRVERVR